MLAGATTQASPFGVVIRSFIAWQHLPINTKVPAAFCTHRTLAMAQLSWHNSQCEVILEHTLSLSLCVTLLLMSTVGFRISSHSCVPKPPPTFGMRVWAIHSATQRRRHICGGHYLILLLLRRAAAAETHTHMLYACVHIVWICIFCWATRGLRLMRARQAQNVIVIVYLKILYMNCNRAVISILLFPFIRHFDCECLCWALRPDFVGSCVESNAAMLPLTKQNEYPAYRDNPSHQKTISASAEKNIFYDFHFSGLKLNHPQSSTSTHSLHTFILQIETNALCLYDGIERIRSNHLFIAFSCSINQKKIEVFSICDVASFHESTAVIRSICYERSSMFTQNKAAARQTDTGIDPDPIGRVIFDILCFHQHFAMQK